MVVLALFLGAPTIVGLIREVRQRGNQAISILALPLYAVLVLVWSYPVAGSLFLLPVFAGFAAVTLD